MPEHHYIHDYRLDKRALEKYLAEQFPCNPDEISVQVCSMVRVTWRVHGRGPPPGQTALVSSVPLPQD